MAGVMYKSISAGFLIFALTACGSGTDQGDDSGDSGDGDTPTSVQSTTDDIGTGSTTQSTARYEARTDDGNGYAESISYNAADDTFTVDNLPFDGDNTYARDDVVASLGPFSVYENDSTYADDVTGAIINQFQHKAIRAVSTSGNTEFSIVRTGAYIPYGFGGFLYQRNTGVVLPSTGEAQYTGDYAGLRDFKGRGGLEYVTGQMEVNIDFEDFNAGDAVDGRITNRRVLDLNGNDITAGITAALSAEQGVAISALPSVLFVIQPGVLKDNGEITGSLNSNILNAAGGLDELESGTYYAVISGTGAGQEIAGIVVIESEDHRTDGVQVRETGGFILYR